MRSASVPKQKLSPQAKIQSSCINSCLVSPSTIETQTNIDKYAYSCISTYIDTYCVMYNVKYYRDTFPCFIYSSAQIEVASFRKEN